jgi:hypothetical protein
MLMKAQYYNLGRWTNGIFIYNYSELIAICISFQWCILERKASDNLKIFFVWNLNCRNDFIIYWAQLYI